MTTTTKRLHAWEQFIDRTFARLREHQPLLSPDDLEDQLADLDRFLDRIDTGDRRAAWHILAGCMTRVRIVLEAQQHRALEACLRHEGRLHFFAGE